MHGTLFDYTNSVAEDPPELNNPIKNLFNNPKHYFELFLTIKYL